MPDRQALERVRPGGATGRRSPAINRPKHPTGISGRYNARWDVMHDYTACANRDIVANCHARADRHVPAEPDVVTDFHGSGEFNAAFAFVRINRVVRGIDVNPRGDEGMVADLDPGAIENHAIEVHVEVFTDRDVQTIVAPEGGFDLKLRPGSPKELAKDLVAAARLILSCGVKEARQPSGAPPKFDEFGIGGAVRLAQ